ncbi:aspartate/glutamate racemase family protein [Candidatus Cloacimonadota bacterium]
MKTIGLIGGTTWESTKEYYQIINEAVQLSAGGYHSAKILLYSVDFQEIRTLSEMDDWDSLAKMFVSIGRKLEAAGAEILLLCANTLHKVYDDVQRQLNIPVLHIADVLAKEVEKTGLKTLGLLGTRITMESDFYISRLKDRFGIETIVPDKAGREIVNTIIFDELAKGIIRHESRQKLIEISEEMIANGAKAVVLGCTELSLILKPSHFDVPVFDTLLIHAASAANFAVKN